MAKSPNHPQASTEAQRRQGQRSQGQRRKGQTALPPSDQTDPRLEQLVTDIIGQVADKWTMLVLEELEEGGCLRFSQLARAIPAISQKMLTQTVRQMERTGLVKRTVHPVIPPHVDYELTGLGRSLGAAFCGVWLWAQDNRTVIETARADFDIRQAQSGT